MWIDSRGVSHTVAIPDPRELMDTLFSTSLESPLAAGLEGRRDTNAPW